MEDLKNSNINSTTPLKIASLDNLFKKSKTVASANQVSTLEDLKAKIKNSYVEKYLLKKQNTAIQLAF